MSRMIPSSRNNPCPVCGRTHDGDCRIGETIVFCHKHIEGTPGEQQGEWRFVQTNDGDHGTGMWKHESAWQQITKTEETFYANRKEWKYYNAEGQHIFSFVREGEQKKSYTPLAGSPADYTDDVVLYRNHDAVKAINSQREKGQDPFVFWVEGEKCADTLWDLGLPAVTTQGGWNNLRPERDGGKLPEDVKIILVPDRDRCGVQYVNNVAELYPENPKQWVRCWPEKPELWNGKCPDKKGLDVADWLKGVERSEALKLLRGAISDDPIVLAVKQSSEATLDAVNLEEFKAWIPTLLDHEEWMRLPMAQKRAKDLGLSLQSRQVSELLKQAEHESRGISIKRRGRRSLMSAAMPALWEGMIPARRACCVVGLPKSNKTQLILNMIGAWWSGEDSYLGRKLNGDCPPVIIVGTDQTEEDWVNSLRRAGLPGDIDPDMESTPIVELWSAEQGLALNAEGIEAIREVAEENPGALIICDSIRKLVVAPLGIEEKDARLISPLQKLELELAPYETSLVYIHHAGKGRAGESPITAGAGGTALPGHVSNMIGLQKVSDRDDESRVQAWIDGRMGRESKFYFDTSESDFRLLGDGADIARIEKMQKAEGGLTEAQEEVLLALREVYVAESLPTTSEQLCNHVGGRYLKSDQKPYLQLMNSKLRALANKGLVESSSTSTRTGAVMLWVPVQLPSDQLYDPF